MKKAVVVVVKASMYDFCKNYFELLGVPVSYVVDLGLAGKNYRSALLRVHPDRFTTASDQEKRLAVQYTALLNEAYTVLKSPLKRAIYFLQCQGIEVDFSGSMTLPTTFLQQQMELHEELREAGADMEKLNKLKLSVEILNEADYECLHSLLVSPLDTDAQQQALDLMAQLMFYEKLLTMIKERQ